LLYTTFLRVLAGPSWTDKVTAIGTATAAGVVIVSAIIALVQLREAERTRLASLVADLSRRWDESLLQTARTRQAEFDSQQLLELVEKSWTTGTADKNFYEMEALPNFFEGIGVLENRTRGLSIALIDDLWGSAILGTWGKWLPTVEYIRSQQTIPTAYLNFEAIKDRVAAYRQDDAGEIFGR
jgi:hypothetical protein